MRRRAFWVKFAVLVVTQILICVYLDLSTRIFISILPALILLLPIKTRTIPALIIAFATGFVVDLLAGSAIGITSASLLVCALTRYSLIESVFGQELVIRSEELSLSRQGWLKMSTGLLIILAEFLLVYILFDSAGTRTFIFNFAKFSLSLLIDFLLCFAVTIFICSDR